MKSRDSVNEVPANFNDYINKWSLEAIACIVLNRRLGILNDIEDENADKLIKLMKKFFIGTYEFEEKPSIWRYYETKAFKELMKTYDDITK